MSRALQTRTLALLFATVILPVTAHAQPDIPKDATAYVNRGNAWIEKKEYDKAMADFNEAIKLAPQCIKAYLWRGTLWREKREYDKAIADFTEAIRLDPQDERAYTLRGIARSDKKEYNKAVADYSEAIRLDPKDALAYNGRGYAWSEKQEYDKAIADYSEAIRLAPKYASAYNNRGIAWQAKKEYDKAIADYSEAIRLNPKFNAAYNGQAWLWATCPDERYRDGRKAVESATKACEITRWKDPADLDTLAASYAEAGDFDAAVKWQSKAIELLTTQAEKDDYGTRIELYRRKKPYREIPAAGPTQTIVTPPRRTIAEAPEPAANAVAKFVGTTLYVPLLGVGLRPRSPADRRSPSAAPACPAA